MEAVSRKQYSPAGSSRRAGADSRSTSRVSTAKRVRGVRGSVQGGWQGGGGVGTGRARSGAGRTRGTTASGVTGERVAGRRVVAHAAAVAGGGFAAALSTITVEIAPGPASMGI